MGYDPNTQLEELRTLVVRLLYERDNDKTSSFAHVEQALEHFRDLDSWLHRGGLLPADWNGGHYNSMTFSAPRTEFSRLLNDHMQLQEQVTATQTSNTDLVEKNRLLKNFVCSLIRYPNTLPDDLLDNPMVDEDLQKLARKRWGL